MTEQDDAAPLAANERQRERFNTLAWPHLSAVLRTATILTGGNQFDAADLAQETMLRAFRGIDGFSGSVDDARKWLLTILRNCRTDRLRTIAGSSPPMSLDALEHDPAAVPTSADHDDEWKNPRELLNRFADAEIITALKQLPEDIRWTLLLTDVEDLDIRQAAEILNVAPGTIKSRASRGRAMLREILLPLAKDRRIVK